MGHFIQLHFLTAYPPANLNRDDLGRPKTAIFGGTQRLRVSSQSLKRAWRTSAVFERTFGELGAGTLGLRTKDLGDFIVEKLLATGDIAEDDAKAIAREISRKLGALDGEDADSGEGDASGDEESADIAAGKKKGKKASEGHNNKQLVHISATERQLLEDLCLDLLTDPERLSAFVAECRGNAAQEKTKRRKAPMNKVFQEGLEAKLFDAKHSTTAVDIAMFGRMLADAPSHNIEAACQVAHALSVHKVAVEDDFFSAVDDLNDRDESRGSGHISTTEFAAGVMYHYVCIDTDLLKKNLNGNGGLSKQAIAALVEACATVAPTGKQNSFGSRARASYLLAERGGQQPRSLCAAFLRPIDDQDLMTASIRALEATRAGMDKVYEPCSDAQSAFNCLTGTGSLADVVAFCQESLS